MQPLQLVLLQLGHKAQAAQVDAQHRHAVERHCPGQVQDRAIAAEGDQQVGPFDLLLQLPDGHAQLVVVALPTERQTHHRFKADALQNLLGALGHLQFAVPIGIGA